MFTAIIPILCNINPCMLFLLSIEKKKRPEICTNNKTTYRLTPPFWLSVIEFLLKCFLIVCLSREVYYRLWS